MIRPKLTFILYFSFTSLLLLGQIKIHKHLTKEDGLISNKVLRIIQDNKGYMWFATFSGVSIWDGNNFKNLTPKEGLTSPAIIDLIEAKDSTIYLSAYGRGIIAYKDGILDTLDKQDGLSSNMVIRIRNLDDEVIFFSDSIQSYQNNQFKNIRDRVNNFKGLLGDIIISDTNLVVASRNTGLYIKDKFVDRIFSTADGLLSNKVDILDIDHDGTILISTVKGLNKYRNGKLTSLKFNGKTFNEAVTDIVVALDSTKYYSSTKGLVIEKDGKVELLTTKNGLLDNSIYCLKEDKHGNIYIGYENNGISIYHPERFSNFSSADEPEKFIANSIIQDANSNIILGSKNGLTILKENKIERLTSLNGLSDNNVMSMTKGKNGDIYFGTRKGFNILKNDRVKSYFANDKIYQEINDMEVSPEGDVIMAVRRQGLHVFTPNNQKSTKYISELLDVIDDESKKALKGQNVDGGIINHVSLQHGLQSSWILDLMFTKDSTLVLGYHGTGASFYKNGKFKHFNKRDGLSDRIVNTIYEHEDGSIWFGTASGGITTYLHGILDTIDVDDGLTSNNIRGIKRVGIKVFITTDAGLNILVQYGNKYFIRNLKKEDGLLANDCNRGAIFLDDKQYIWIGNKDGVSKYNPMSDKKNIYPPELYFTGFEIFNEEFPLDDFLNSQQLNYDENYIKFKFTGINLAAPEKIKYNYKLSGVDKNWVNSIDHYATYTNLDDGDYKFEIRASNEWGYWSQPKRIAFTINPAWWETWWFYSLAVLAVGFLIAFISSYKYRNLLAIEKMRTKISADLHDSVGSGLSEISILTEFLGAQIPEDHSDLKSGLGNVAAISRNLIDSMSDIVWLVNPKKDSLKDLFKRLQISYHEVLKYSDIELSVDNIDDLENIRLPMNFRQHLYLIFKEAINNAIKYSEGDLLNLAIETSGNNLVVTFSDNGRGFNQDEKNLGNGLLNMKNRAKEIGGNIEYFSNPNEGTTVKFTGRFQKQKSSFM